MKSFISKFICALLLISASTSVQAEAKANAKPSYTITPNTSPIDKSMKKYSTYNHYTKHYYVLRSYLEKLEKTGGGTLTLKAGTYTISNTVYIPSHVKIILDGATIKKGVKTGTSRFPASKSIFQLIAPSKAAKHGVYGKYDGEKNIAILGKHKASIDLGYADTTFAIIAGHNQNVTIENITFRNMHSGHFIEMDATKGALIKGNRFLNSVASVDKNKEAINLDTPDRSTKGWSQEWSKFDCTANKDITIENNQFYNLDRSIGTHKYSGGSYHDHIVVKHNDIEKMREDAIRVMNWSHAEISDNTIHNVAGGESGKRGILASGAMDPTFKNNRFQQVGRPIQFMVWKNSGPGSQYEETGNDLSSANKKALKTNVVKQPTENFIRINKYWNQFEHPEKIYVHVTH
ncbi:hypothetical protein A374_02574 [Fictibacillus macauensis ZFHKF-1]|uniref:Right handed beta helix domain-containing protein n=1 Tax=Fictibacillus macauensis ZFHKF-1 TaxID=1196324 RepID=I8AMB3_9BACL|nr:right-handed parallel beta-helix repeat-containing protein [Fictibacillus macauensis]EIT87102.1 hypothetical protein A374_02574 [Fictibacillus macauensis ZFHKF-1]